MRHKRPSSACQLLDSVCVARIQFKTYSTPPIPMEPRKEEVEKAVSDEQDKDCVFLQMP